MVATIQEVTLRELTRSVSKDATLDSVPWGAALTRLIKNNFKYDLMRAGGTMRAFYDWFHRYDQAVIIYVLDCVYNEDMDLFIGPDGMLPEHQLMLNRELITASASTGANTVSLLVILATLGLTSSVIATPRIWGFIEAVGGIISSVLILLSSSM